MKKPAILVLSLLLLSSFSAYSTTDAQQQAIESLGQLNGVALQCRYNPDMQLMKQAMVENLPKQRSLGELYDNATNAAFLGFAQQHKACPDNAEFTGTVSAAIDKLKQAFSHH
ncbi:hypothetical protein MNBD_GAMMA25-176 [hydrothermal vent metagenome]|uniref:Uncharacterized protein n=1 Tax=hydrothermal vent metagenome TaxID=652676 RepID=A0A3B1B0M5_9ZZZZ